jgi:hypothetical protein
MSIASRGTFGRRLTTYLRYGQDHGFMRQSQLVEALDYHPDRPRLIEWLRVNGGDLWTK